MAVTLQGSVPQYTGTPYRCAAYVERCNQRGGLGNRKGLGKLALRWEISTLMGSGWVHWQSGATTEGGFRVAITRRLEKLGLDKYKTLVTIRLMSTLEYKGAKLTKHKTPEEMEGEEDDDPSVTEAKRRKRRK